MNYSEEALKSIEDLSEIFIKISDIAVIIDVPADVLREDVSNRSNPAYKAYRRGKIRAKVKLRRQEMEFAAVGSPLAMENTMKALTEMEDDE